MDLEARKLEFIKEFITLKDIETIAQLEEILRKEKNTMSQQKIKNMTHDELNKRINQSESDFKNNRFKSSKELISKYE